MKIAAAVAVTVGLLALVLGVPARGHAAERMALAGWATFDEVPSDASLRARGIRPVHRFVSIPAVAVAGSQRALRRLGAERVEWDRPVQPALDTATRTSHAADVWGTKWWPESSDVNLGDREQLSVDGEVIDGTGVTVAVVDTGINGAHPDLWYAAAQVDGTPFPAKTLECVHGWSVAAAPNPYCDETSSHGSMVAGVVAGNASAVRAGLAEPGQGPFLGVAPGANLVGAGLGVAGGTALATAALDWVYANADRYGIRAVNASWGFFPSCSAGFPSEFVTQVSNALVRDKGAVVVFAAGNYGSTPAPTNIFGRNPTPGVISAANYDDGNAPNRRGSINPSSMNGCTGEQGDLVWTWPDISAPGTNITTTTSYSQMGERAPFYATGSGTSFAAPHIAGAAALMFQANPDLTPGQVERILIETATPWDDDVPVAGFTGPEHWGEVNASAGTFVDRSDCAVTPEDAADPAAASARFPKFDQLPEPDLYVCRDFKRGSGLVDVHAAVARAIASRSNAG